MAHNRTRQVTNDHVGPQRHPNGKWVKGSSGNSGGQPQWVREFREAFAHRCAPKAEQVLYDVLSGAEPDAKVSDKVHAADTVLKYVLPKPSQQVEVTVDDKREAFAGLTTAELTELAKQKPQEDET